MTPEHTRKILMASEFVATCAAVARQREFDLKTTGVEMMKFGYAMLMDVPLDAADVLVRRMLLLSEPQVGPAQ